MKRIISLLLAAALLFSALISAFPVFAEDEEPEIILPDYEIISFNETKSVEITEAGTFVYFGFTPEESGYYSLSSSGEQDTYCTVYNFTGETVSSDDNGGEDANFNVIAYLEAGTLYLYEVNLVSEEDVGEFNITLAAAVVPSDFSFVKANPLTYVEGTNGFYNNGSFYYFVSQGYVFEDGDVINITYSDASVKSYTYSKSINSFVNLENSDDLVDHYYFNVSADQSRPWKKGYSYDINIVYTAYGISLSDIIKVYIYSETGTPDPADTNALEAAIALAQGRLEGDYKADGLENLQAVINTYSEYLSFEDLSQEEADSATAAILTAISELVPCLILDVSANGGSVSVSYSDVSGGAGSYSPFFGNEITLTATADEGFAFAGWYETVTKRIFSYDEQYSFAITSNTFLQARFVEQGASQLVFTNDSGQIESIIAKTPAEWAELGSIASIIPAVPYKYGFINGHWIYDDDAVIQSLSAGEDVTILPEYTQGDYVIPEMPEQGDIPNISLNYASDDENNIYSFIMQASIPEGCEVEAIGTLFYYDLKGNYDLSAFDVDINNKMLVSKFNEIDPDGIYITNIRNFRTDCQWSVRGYVSYYDGGVLKTAYSNQINLSLNQ